MDLNKLKYGNAEYSMMALPLYGVVLLWMQPLVEGKTEDEFIHFVAGIKNNGLTVEQKNSIKVRRSKYPNTMPLEFGAYLNMTLDCIIQNNVEKFEKLGYKLNHDQVETE